MIIFPAIDLREGKCVRLVQGQLDQETVFSEDPVDIARTWEAQGANFLHVVDLDGAFAGKPQNLDVVKEIVEAVSIPVQLGGGIRNLETIDQILALGVNRVILGTVAIGNPELVKKACEKHPQRIVVGIDSKNSMVAVEGWGTTSERTTVELAMEMKEAGVKEIIFTDISRDGMMKGPNIESTKELAEKSGLKIIASGGVASLEDIRALKKIESAGVKGVIVGKALYTEAIHLPEALAVAQEEVEV